MKIIFAFIIVSLFAVACNNSEGEKARDEKESYQVTKEKLEEKEKKTPALFLTIKGHDKQNLLGQTVVKGTITNKATVAPYKDVDVKLDFYSKTGTLLETDRETIYENLKPGEAKDFKTKYFAPKGTDSVALEVLGAKIGDK